MAAVTAWAANTAYSLGDIRKASDIQYTGVHFKVVTAGTSGGSEPTWSSEFASQTTDNNVVWEAVSSAFAEVSKINPSNIIELFELELVTAIHGNNSTYRFHNGVSEYQGSKLRISNLLGTITSLLLTLPQGLEGAKVTRIRTLERYIDDINFETDQLLLEDGNYFLLEDGNYISQEGVANPHGDPDTVTFPYEIFTIDRKSSENREVVEFELAADFDVQNVRLPKRQVLPSDFPGVGTFY
jgi:phage-related protein